jgi:hypothetical protein
VGNDKINGGSGTDIYLVPGASWEYDLSLDKRFARADEWTISSKKSAAFDTGRDTLIDVELIRFTNVLFDTRSALEIGLTQGILADFGFLDQQIDIIMPAPSTSIGLSASAHDGDAPWLAADERGGTAESLLAEDILQFDDGYLDLGNSSFTDGYANERVEALMTRPGYSTDPDPTFVAPISVAQVEGLVTESETTS